MDKVGAVFLLRADNAALMQHRDDKPGLRHSGLWVPPGGHCEREEAIIDCARREFLEETCYRCERLHFLLSFCDEQEGWPPYELTVFWTRYDGKQRFECREGQGLEFILREEAVGFSIPPYLLDIWDRVITAAERPCDLGERHA